MSAPSSVSWAASSPSNMTSGLLPDATSLLSRWPSSPSTTHTTRCQHQPCWRTQPSRSCRRKPSPQKPPLPGSRPLAAQPVGQKRPILSSAGSATRIRTWNLPVNSLVQSRTIQPCPFAHLLEIAVGDVPRSPLGEVGWFHSVGLEPSGCVLSQREHGAGFSHSCNCPTRPVASHPNGPGTSRPWASLLARAGMAQGVPSIGSSPNATRPLKRCWRLACSGWN